MKTRSRTYTVGGCAKFTRKDWQTLARCVRKISQDDGFYKCKDEPDERLFPHTFMVYRDDDKPLGVEETRMLEWYFEGVMHGAGIRAIKQIAKPRESFSIPGKS